MSNLDSSENIIMQDTATPASAPRPSRKGLYIPIFLFTLVCVGWSGFWFFAKNKAGDIMDAWLAREAQLGRNWTCPDRDIGGFPFRMEVSCAKPSFQSREPGRAGSGSLESLTVAARVLDPKQLIAAFGAPLRWQSTAGDSIELTWKTARVSYRGVPGTLDQASVEMQDPKVIVQVPGLDAQEAKATLVEFHLRRSPGEEPGTDIALTANGLVYSPLDALIGQNVPGSIMLKTSISKLLPHPPRDWRVTAEEWRNAGGVAKIEQLRLTKGAIDFDVKGQLKIDALHRMEGYLDGSATGINALMARFGGNAAAAGGLLGSLLTGGRQQGAEKPLPVMLRFENGRGTLGPIPLVRLQPLY